MDTSKIVDLQQRQASQAATTDRVGELLKLVRTTALKRVNGLVSNLFENIDDALFDLAEKAGIRVVTLANNHSMDFGPLALEERQGQD